jgi:hypothetical protein
MKRAKPEGAFGKGGQNGSTSWPAGIRRRKPPNWDKLAGPLSHALLGVFTKYKEFFGIKCTFGRKQYMRRFFRFFRFSCGFRVTGVGLPVNQTRKQLKKKKMRVRAKMASISLFLSLAADR